MRRVARMVRMVRGMSALLLSLAQSSERTLNGGVVRIPQLRVRPSI